jgi:hypothetical protein
MDKHKEFKIYMNNKHFQAISQMVQQAKVKRKHHMLVYKEIFKLHIYKCIRNIKMFKKITLTMDQQLIIFYKILMSLLRKYKRITIMLIIWNRYFRKNIEINSKTQLHFINKFFFIGNSIFGIYSNFYNFL